ncbi:hypothetical protein Ancab_001610, partial [Ancistrocladus abbreviatus]
KKGDFVSAIDSIVGEYADKPCVQENHKKRCKHFLEIGIGKRRIRREATVKKIESVYREREGHTRRARDHAKIEVEYRE